MSLTYQEGFSPVTLKVSLLLENQLKPIQTCLNMAMELNRMVNLCQGLAFPWTPPPPD